MRIFFIKMHLYRFFLIVAFLFSFNIIAIADHHEDSIVIEDAIIVESEFDLDEAYKEKDFSDIDPIEGFNREVWDFNLGLDKVLVRPITRGYVDVIPDPFRRGIGNAIDNFFTTPQYFINNASSSDLLLISNPNYIEEIKKVLYTTCLKDIEIISL